MWSKVRAFMTLPREIEAAFWEDSLRKNQISLLVIAIMIFGMELFNIARVLFWSSAGLGTLNNRIYFGLYCALLAGAGLYLVLQHLLRGRTVRVRWAVQYGAVWFFFLWHILLNAYDLIRNPGGETFTFFTAVMGLAVFIQMPSLFSGICFGLGYVLFLLLTAGRVSVGDQINLTFSVIVALAVSLTHSHHTVVEIAQRQEIRRMNGQLQLLLRQDPLTGLLNKKASENCVSGALEAAGPDRPLALLLLDLDDFKAVNDRYGHPQGDAVLEKTAQALRRTLTADGTCIGRVGGDEFLALISPAGDGRALEEQGRRILEAVAAIRWPGQEAPVRCSLGILRVSRPGVSYEAAYQAVDRALYEAKRAGKGRCCLQAI